MNTALKYWKKDSKKNFEETKKLVENEVLPQSKEELKKEIDKIDEKNGLPYHKAICALCAKCVFGILKAEPFFIDHCGEGVALCGKCYKHIMETIAKS